MRRIPAKKTEMSLRTLPSATGSRAIIRSRLDITANCAEPYTLTRMRVVLLLSSAILRLAYYH